jgi:hypothetical protein
VTHTETGKELIAFNEDYFKVTDVKEEGNTISFYSKDNLMHRIYNYKLFNYADGRKLDMNSGFPIETEDGKHGYIGNWGIWAPHGTSISNGETVTDMDGVEYVFNHLLIKLHPVPGHGVGLAVIGPGDGPKQGNPVYPLIQTGGKKTCING